MGVRGSEDGERMRVVGGEVRGWWGGEVRGGR